jgi:hypothetical protein
MREKVMALELTISSGAEEKGQYEVLRILMMLRTLCQKGVSSYLCN